MDLSIYRLRVSNLNDTDLRIMGFGSTFIEICRYEYVFVRMYLWVYTSTQHPEFIIQNVAGV